MSVKEEIAGAPVRNGELPGDATDLELLEKICRRYHLGALTEEPRRLGGGFLHKMYRLFTTKGRYALKLLNPFIMQRSTAMENYRTAEALEHLLEEKGLPIIPARVFEGRKMQEMDGQYFYLYEWYDGTALREEEIREIHCRKVGALLAQIHALDRRGRPYERAAIQVDWDNYIEQFSGRNEELCRLLGEQRGALYESQRQGSLAVRRLPPVVTICHNDMDSKNVLWSGTDCRVIDLECLGYSSPFLELYELALCWAGYAGGRIEFRLFRAFLRSYAEAGGQLPADWETVYWSNCGRLEWLEYNLKRALGIDCRAEEIGLGILEAKRTLAQVACYQAAREEILRHCRASATG